MRRKLTDSCSCRQYLFRQSSQRGTSGRLELSWLCQLPVLVGATGFVLLFPYLLLAETAAFPDPNLAACVAETMNAKDVAAPHDLAKLSCNARKIEDLTGIGTLSKLTELSLFGNELRAVDLHDLPYLTSLNLADNLLREVDVSKNPELRTLYLFGNRLTTLDLRNNSRLEKVRAEKNRLIEIAFGEMPALEKVYLFDNQLEGIEIDSLTGLRFVDVRSNPMPDEVYDYLDGFSGVRASHDGNTEAWK